MYGHTKMMPRNNALSNNINRALMTNHISDCVVYECDYLASLKHYYVP